jgi:hypothetical protein
MTFDPEWKPSSPRDPEKTLAVVLFVILGVAGLGVIAFFVLAAVAMSSFGSNK